MSSPLFETFLPGVAGTQTSLSALTLEDCVAYWKKVSGPRGVTITAAGDVKGTRLAKRIEKRLAPWLAQSGASFRDAPALPPFDPPQDSVSIDRPLQQTTILIGQRGVTRTDPVYYALQIFNYALGGGGFSSRLVDEIRDNRGLAYSVSSGLGARLLAGPFQIQLKTKNATGSSVAWARPR